MARTSKDEAVRISEAGDGTRQFLLHPENDDLFVRTGKQVISSCQLGISVELWLDELGSMMDEAQKWSQTRSGRIRSCYCAPKGSKVVFFFAIESNEFDYRLADELADLNAEMNNAFNVGIVELHQIPCNEFDRFLDPGTARIVYGEELETHTTMEA